MENFDDLVQGLLLGSPWTHEFEVLVAANPQLQAAIEAALAAQRASASSRREAAQ